MTRTPQDYFARMYSSDPDPWGFETSWYERRKYDLTLAALPDPVYRSAFEPGCSIGVLSEGLAARCERLQCMEQMPKVAAAATERLAHLPHVEVGTGQVPEDWPPGPFDLLVLSELCYYFDEAELAGFMKTAARSLAPGGVVVAVHWRGATDYPLSGDDSHTVIATTPSLVSVAGYEETKFLLGVWRSS